VLLFVLSGRCIVFIQRRRLKCVEANGKDGIVLKDDQLSRHDVKQLCLRGEDEEAVTMETTSDEIPLSVDAGVKTDDVVNEDDDDDDDDDDDGSDEIEDGELVSSSTSESELEPEEAVEEKGKT